jgi:hypothetical protein
MELLRPILFFVLLFVLSMITCAITNLVVEANPLLFVISIVGNMLGTLVLMDYIDALWL